MPRRRLRLSTFSDEEENDDVEPQNHQPQQYEQSPTVTHPPLNPNPNRSEPLEISDDEEFIDVSDNLSSPSPPQPEPNSNQQPRPQVAQPSSGGGCPISGFLQGLGLRLKREWSDACVYELERSDPGFASLDVGVKAKLVFQRFLVSDMNYSGGGGLPENVHSLHLVDLPGPFVLQVGLKFLTQTLSNSLNTSVYVKSFALFAIFEFDFFYLIHCIELKLDF